MRLEELNQRLERGITRRIGDLKTQVQLRSQRLKHPNLIIQQQKSQLQNFFKRLSTANQKKQIFLRQNGNNLTDEELQQLINRIQVISADKAELIKTMMYQNV